ncbi:YfiT family bacillithiol transferase [Paenibacillus provencensis]|uniref:YfiT family bacillithiol transferase n=1 Tax=Paenibacillus provencensis TaxID=441151 RepID=A0ABW3PTL1_9BACL|nr:putative metal-dependent hydrolase [Paenibacillus sp. MER 78]MCM3127444.1 putative metal-dependent hydrolase [Paenibacillus sp. MER 78]
MNNDLRYPIGLEVEDTPNNDNRRIWMDNIKKHPARLQDAVADLSNEQLATPYRPEGWTINQVVHHVADSHMNSFIRFKLALTENEPAIRPYEETLWAETTDVSDVPISASLSIIEGLHSRWTALLESMSPEQYDRTFYHPGLQKSLTLGECLRLYSWHSLHHTAHITSLRERMNW